MIIRDHLISGVEFRESPNTSGSLVPELIVCHYTATTSSASAIAALCSERFRASAHLVVDTDGTVTQLVSFDKRAWHAGKSEWAGRSRLNDWSIGIEIVNPGPLKEKNGGFVDVYNRPYSGEVFLGRHQNVACSYQYWARYTDAQIAAVIECGRALIAAYGITEAIGHEDCSPGRKIDPGPAFPWEQLRDAWFPQLLPSVVNVVRNGQPDASIPVASGARLSWDAESLTLSIDE